jgi:IS5 family transposase
MRLFDSCIDKKLGKNNQLIKLELLIDWKPVKAILEKVHKRDELNRSGGFSYDKLKMFKAILLGQWHSLSDAKLEETLNVRLDFMRFCGFELDDEIPDHSSLNRFRNKLIQRKLEEKLLLEVNRQLEKQELKVQRAEAAIIDATVIESSARPRRVLEVSEDRKELLELASDALDAVELSSTNYEVVESCDKDAKWLKKGKRSYYGYKAFVSVDNGDGYINDIHVTPANVSEVNEFNEITKNVNAKRVMSDKGYASAKNRDSLRARKIKNGVMYKASSKKELTQREKLFNRIVSKSRYVVERTIGTLKNHFCCSRAKYLGLIKVKAQLFFKAICHNLLKAVNKIKLIKPNVMQIECEMT